MATKKSTSLADAADADTPERAVRSTALSSVFVAALPAALLLVMATRHRWMADDGFIYSRIVRHLVEGHGPVFNTGDRVEAFTSPLWVAILALPTALGLRAEPTAVALGIGLTVAALLCAQAAAYRLHVRAGGPRPPWMVPLGATVMAVLPPCWDFASSGLEIGLTFFWLAAAYLVVVVLAARPRPLAQEHVFAAALVGLGPLVRPELALYSIAIFVPLARAVTSRRRILPLLATASFLPLSYQVFRMGYFAAITANTAIAKEAFAFNFGQGILYARDFVGLYHLPVPLLAIAVTVSLRWPAKRSLVMLAPVVAACVHALHIVATGGDFMHGRLFLPCLFAALLPASMIAPPRAEARQAAMVLFCVNAALLLAWSCFPRYWHARRVDDHGIFDERAWYAHRAKTTTPVVIGDYAGQEFFVDGERLAARVTAGEHAIVGENTGYGTLTPRAALLTMTPRAAPGISAVVDASAIGITGYVLPSSVHVVDHLGLADALASRVELGERGRPGHEKKLPNAWVMARWTAPALSGVEDGSVSAARRALACPPLQRLEHATRAPLSPALFVENLARAFGLQRLRIPRDPVAAEARLCGTPEPTSLVTSGTGGEEHRWLCPDGMSLSGFRGSRNAGEHAIASLQPHCSNRGADITTGPTFGEPTNDSFIARCPRGEDVVGIEGHARAVVTDVALVCRGATPAVDQPSFRLMCPEGSVVVGAAGGRER